MRKLLVAGNWKMNGSQSSVNELVDGLAELVGTGLNGVDVLVCPPAIFIPQVSEAVKGSGVAVGGQNVSEYDSGAYTGELSKSMLSEFGCRYAIVGHSERRSLFAESDEQIAAKCQAVLGSDLTPILCVGETLEQRESGLEVAVVTDQVKAVIDQVGIGAFASAVIAYEPVWAIGTGLTASPEQAQEIHAAIRTCVAEYDLQVAEKVQILYGGSVNAANAEELFSQQDIDGGLVGGASLKVNDFYSICSAAATVSQAV